MYAPCKVHMIVFQQNHVEQTDTVIASSTYLYSHFLHNTHTRSSFTGIKDTSFGTFQLFHIFMGHSSNAAHTLHDVQHQALCLKQGLNFTFNHHRHITRFHVTSVLNEYLYLHGRIKTMEYLLSYINTSQPICLPP